MFPAFCGMPALFFAAPCKKWYGGMGPADCPDGYCIRQGKITGKGQVIVCLPHRLVLEVTGEESGDGKKEDLDAVVH